MKLTWFSVLLFFLLVLGLAQVTLARDAPIVRTGNTEVGGFVGGSFGIDKVRVMGGGNAAYAATRVAMPYAEFSYFPGIGPDILVPDFHGGVHLRVPLKDSRVIPTE